MVILENIDIDIDIDKAILQNIDIDKISNWFKFGISNRAIDGTPLIVIRCYATDKPYTMKSLELRKRSVTAYGISHFLCAVYK